MPFDAIEYINTPRWLTSRLGLERIRELLDRLGRPQDRLKFVHVAGTNGKGSTCAFTASILAEAGFKTGLFTSPYVETFHERIRVNGRNPQVYVFHALADDMRLDSVYDRDFARGRGNGDARTCPFVGTSVLSQPFSLVERLFFTFSHFTRAHGPRLVGIRHNATFRRRARSRRRRFGKARTRQRSPWRFLCCARLRP